MAICKLLFVLHFAFYICSHDSSLSSQYQLRCSLILQGKTALDVHNTYVLISMENLFSSLRIRIKSEYFSFATEIRLQILIKWRP